MHKVVAGLAVMVVAAAFTVVTPVGPDELAAAETCQLELSTVSVATVGAPTPLAHCIMKCIATGQGSPCVTWCVGEYAGNPNGEKDKCKGQKCKIDDGKPKGNK